jgi:putative flippase GtrA
MVRSVLALAHQPGFASGVGAQGMRYMLASGLALAVDLLAYTLLLGAGYLAIVAGAAGYCCGLCVHYRLSVTWVFAHGRTGGAKRAWRFARFALTGLLGSALTATVIALLARYAAVDNYQAKLLAALIVYVAVFALRRAYVFRSTCSY